MKVGLVLASTEQYFRRQPNENKWRAGGKEDKEEQEIKDVAYISN